MGSEMCIRDISDTLSFVYWDQYRFKRSPTACNSCHYERRREGIMEGRVDDVHEYQLVYASVLLKY